MDATSITIRAPLIITPRLMPGAAIGSGFLSISYSDRPGDGGRTRYLFAIDATHPDGGEALEYEADDLQSGEGGGTMQEGLSSLLSFLLDAAEGVDYTRRTGRAAEGSDNFPTWVSEWAYFVQDELEALAIDLEAPDLITEAL